jgi:hypothetical protein
MTEAAKLKEKIQFRLACMVSLLRTDLDGKAIEGLEELRTSIDDLPER